LVLASLSVNSDVSKLIIDNITPNIVSVMKTIFEVCGLKFKLKEISDDYLTMKKDRLLLLKEEDLKNDLIEGAEED